MDFISVFKVRDLPCLRLLPVYSCEICQLECLILRLNRRNQSKQNPRQNTDSQIDVEDDDEIPDLPYDEDAYDTYPVINPSS
jgi:hypothetical protein